MATKTIPQLAANTAPSAAALVEVSDAGVSGKSTTPQIVLSGTAAIADDRIIANTSGGSAKPVANTGTAVLDACFGATKGQILVRNATVWTVLAPGVDGQVLTMVSGEPAWADLP